MGNRYLTGPFAPVTEEVTVTDLEVTGSLPDHLDGRYLRNGPNPIDQPNPAAYHWFLGDGMVHGIRLRGGRAEWYRNRWIRSPKVAAALGEQPHPGPVFAGMDFGPNTNVIGHAGRTFAIVEAGARPYELTDELDTIGPCDLEGTLEGGYTAHPKLDPETGELHAMSYSPVWGRRVQYTVIGTDGRVRRAVDIELPASPMMHDFSLTEKYVVVYDLPVVLDGRMAAASAPRLLRPIVSRLAGRFPVPPAMFARMAGGDGGDLPGFPYRWDPDHTPRVGLLPRDGEARDIRWFEVEPCYVFHPLNAYDDGDRVVLDVVRHPRMFATDLLGPNEGDPTLDRWTVDIAAGKVIEERLDDHSQEFPRVDERVVGRRHRFGYAAGVSLTGEGPSAVLRHDLVSGETTARDFGPGNGAGEFVFVPSAPDAAEDDGVVMGIVHHAATDRGSLVVLDAQTLEDVARVQLPVRVPYGFHGNWVPAAN